MCNLTLSASVPFVLHVLLVIGALVSLATGLVTALEEEKTPPTSTTMAGDQRRSLHHAATLHLPETQHTQLCQSTAVNLGDASLRKLEGS